MKPWDGIIPVEEQEAYRAAGFGRPTGIGRHPALLIIDVQYRTVGTQPRPFREAIKEFPTSCGEIGWDAVKNIWRLLAFFRENKWPVLYPHVSPKEKFDHGRLSDKVPAIMGVAARGYDFVAETVLALDPKNPQVAARMTTAFRSWRALEPVRRGRAEAALRRIAAAPTLSRDLRDITARSLDGA